jgi:transcriptional regulator with XRE-family HTH domain
MTIDEVAQAIGLSKSALSRIENGIVGVKLPVLRALLSVYGVAGGQAERLEGLAREAGQRGWWQVGVGDIPTSDVKTLVGLEAEAAWINDFSCSVINGLLQTREYAKAVLGATLPDASQEDLELAIEFRIRRQERLGAFRFWAILAEEILTRPVGGSAVMRRQVDHLLAVSDQPRITMQVVGRECGEYIGLSGGFTIIGFDPPDPEVVYLEGYRWDACVEDVAQAELYKRSFEVLRAVALSPEASRARIRSLAEDLAK